MVQVFHWNRRLFQCKFLSFVAILSFLFLIHFFEISYHLLKKCTEEEPIDVVYTWVNGSDLKFQQLLGFYLHKYKSHEIDSSNQRYDDKNELKFSLRSLEKYAPWIGHVYIVTNGQIPYWLNLDYEKVSLVTHEEIFTDSFNLPTFSSPAIEAHLHRIRGLSKRFIYFNDDIFLGSPVYKEDFYSPNRGFLIYLAWLLQMCAPECSWLYVADGHCDDSCNNLKCQMDGGDCDSTSNTLIGDVIVKFEEYEVPVVQETNYEKISLALQNSSFTRNFSTIRHLHYENVSDLITQHNKKVLLLDKLKRRKVRKQLGNVKTIADAYAESLQYTNRILNDYYGFSVRKVPAHAPIMLDRDIMNEMQQKFGKFFERTARNRIRSVDDLQFAFAYYYFVIHEKIELSIDEIFNMFDTDSSGEWSDIEIRNVVAKLYDLPLNDEVFRHFTNMLVNCSGRSLLPTLLITNEFIKNCYPLSNFLKLHFEIKHKYRFEMIKDAEKKHVSFKMLTSNFTQVLHQLDDLRKNAKKFICLNDNLDANSDRENVKKLMNDFYISLFPVPSEFELPERYKNRFLYMEDYTNLIAEQHKNVFLLCFSLVVIILVLFTNFCKRRLCELVETCLNK